MPTPTTNNLSAGSILDLLGPATSSLRDSNSEGDFGSLLAFQQPFFSTSPPPSEGGLDKSGGSVAADANSAARPALTAAERSNAPNAAEEQAHDSADNAESASVSDQNDGDVAQGQVKPTADRDDDAEQPSSEEQQVIQPVVAIVPAVTADTQLAEAGQGGSEVGTDLFSDDASNAEAAQSGSTLPVRPSASPISATQQTGEAATSPEAPGTLSPQEGEQDSSNQGTRKSLRKSLAGEQNADVGVSLTSENDSHPGDGQIAAHTKSATVQPLEPVATTLLEPGAATSEQPDAPQPANKDKSELVLDQTPRLEGTPSSGETTLPSADPLPVGAIPLAPAGGAEPRTASSSSSNGTESAVGSVRTRTPLEVRPEHSQGAGRRSQSEIDTTRLVARVARAFQTAQQRDGEIRIRLSPPELGALRLSVQVQDGQLVAHLETESPAARTAILDNLPSLRERLAEQGVRIERFDVDLMQRQFGGTPDRPQDQERNVPRAARGLAAGTPRASSAAASRPLPASADGTGRLNVIV